MPRMRKELREQLREALMKIKWAAVVGGSLRMKECTDDMFRVISMDAIDALRRIDREEAEVEAEAIEEDHLLAAESDSHS